MGTLYVSYFGSLHDSGGVGNIISSETITTSASTAAGGTIPSHAAWAQCFSAVAHYVTVGTGTPTAAATNSVVQPTALPIMIRLDIGNTAKKIAAITA